MRLPCGAGQGNRMKDAPSPSKGREHATFAIGGLGWGWGTTANHVIEPHPPPGLPLEGGGEHHGVIHAIALSCLLGPYLNRRQ